MQIKQKKILIAASALAAVAFGLAVVIHAGPHLGVDLSGPSKIGRAADGSVWIVSGKQLHHLAPDGRRLQKIDFPELGVADVVSGIALAKDEIMFIAQATPSSILRCELRQKKCVDITPAITAGAGATSYALMMAVDDAKQRLLISDNAGHRVLITDFDGKVLDVSAPQRFIFPNQPSWLSSDEIVVPDTSHQRIVRIAVKDDKLGQDLAQYGTGALSVSRSNRLIPMDVLRDSFGNWWALIAQSGMKNADLVQLDAQGKALARIDLDEASDPTAIAITTTAEGQHILVAEPLRARLTSVSPNGANVELAAFGDSAFQSDLEALRSQRTLWKYLKTAAQILVAAAPLLAALMLSRLEKTSGAG